MPQLSILIPFSGNDKELETTLVSVLENRPYQCEVIVVHSGNYTDPYDLNDEVRFLEVDADEFQLGKILTRVIDQINSPILHLLACGVQVTAGWTNDVVEAFDDPYVGSACPVVLNEDESVFCLGVENSVLYRNRFLAKARQLGHQDYGRYEPIGPSQFAGFYRTDALREVSCLKEFSESLFGLETGLALEAVGYECQLLESSEVRVHSIPKAKSQPEDSQTAIWRFAGSLGMVQGLALTMLGLVTDLLSAPVSSLARRSFTSRIRKFVDRKSANEFRDYVESATGPVTGGHSVSMNAYDRSEAAESSASKRRAA